MRQAGARFLARERREVVTLEPVYRRSHFSTLIDFLSASSKAVLARVCGVTVDEFEARYQLIRH